MPPPPPITTNIPHPAIGLGPEVKEEVEFVSANNPGTIPRIIRTGNAITATSTLTGRIISNKLTTVAKKGSTKRVNSVRS